MLVISYDNLSALWTIRNSSISYINFSQLLKTILYGMQYTCTKLTIPVAHYIRGSSKAAW